MKLKKLSSIALSAIMTVTSAMSAFAAVSPIGATTLEAITTPHNYEGARANTDEAYTFKFASDTSKTFIMLDENEDGEMFVLAKDTYGKRVYSTDADAGVLHATLNEDGTYTAQYDDPARIPSWLNNDFLENGNTYNGVTYSLPADVKNNLVETTWQFEPFTICFEGNVTDGATVNQASMTSKVSLLSATEFEKYKNIIGYSDGLDLVAPTPWGDNSCQGWWLRSMLSGNPKVSTLYNPAHLDPINTWESSAGAARASLSGNCTAAVRPCFYLAKDFVLNTKLDTASMGDKVKEYIKGKYSETQLKAAGYTDEEIKAIFASAEPTPTPTPTPDPEPTPADDTPVSPIGSTSTSLSQIESPHNVSGARENTDTDYTFKTASDTDKTFIMLDENDEGNMFVLAKDTYGKRIYSTGDNYGEIKYSLNDDGTYTVAYDGEERLLYWLDNDFLANGYEFNGTTYKLPDDIKNNLVNINWQFEPFTTASGVSAKQQSMKAKISLLSATEYEKYKDIIGYSDGLDLEGIIIWDDHIYGWWLRTNSSGGYTNLTSVSVVSPVATYESAAGAVRGHALGTSCSAAVRPCFYLAKDFILNTKLDVDSMGDKVKEYIKGKYSETELKAAGYTDEEIKAIFASAEPTPTPTPTPTPDPEPTPTPDAPVSPIGTTSLAEIKTPHNYEGARANTNENYTFKIASDMDKTFIMLDKNEKNQMFVLTKNTYGKRIFSTGANYGELKYTVNDDGTYTVAYDGEERLLYWLENDFLANGNTYEGTTYTLPDDIKNHLANISWQFEPFTVNFPNDVTDGAKVNQGSMTSKISLLSATEYEMYKNIIGYSDGLDLGMLTTWGDNSMSGWWLRSHLTGDATNSKVSTLRNPVTLDPTDTWESAAGAARVAINGDCTAAVRPCFYLDEDFALKVKLDVDTMGAKVKEFIKETYERSVLESAELGYTEEELNSIYGVQETEIAGFNFKNAENGVVTALAGGASVKGVYSVTNKITTAVTAMAVTASYDKTTGRLLGVAYTGTPVSIAAGQTAEVESPVIVLPADVSNVIVKSFL